MVKVGGEGLYHIDEELSPVAEEVDEEEWDDEWNGPDLEEVNGPECLWCDGEHGDPEEWMDRVAGEVERKRLEMQVLEKPEGSAKGISCLTARNVVDGMSIKRWKRRSRVVARESAFAEGKRDDIFSPAILCKNIQ